MSEPHESKEFLLLLRAYDRIADRNTAEHDRLYHLVVGYLAGAAGAVTWLLGSHKNLQDVDPIFWPAASVCTTLYLVFNSYASVCLIDTALYLRTTWERLNTFNKGEIVPSWDAFLPDTHFRSTRKLLNLFFLAWRGLALAVSLALPLLSVGRSRLLDYASAGALVFAVLVGGIAFVVSAGYVAGAYRRLDIKKEILF